MQDLGLTPFVKLYPMLIHKYKDLVVDQNASVTDKMNQIITQLNALGKLNNEVVRDWNTVYQWAMGDGLQTDVNNKLEDMKTNGEINNLLQTIFNSLAGDITQLQTVHKDTLVNAINDNVTSLAQKVSQGDLFINVKDYGAKGDGTTDDTSAIQSAINAVVLSQGKCLLFTSGTYKITNYINIPSGAAFKIKGVSRGSVIIKQYTSNTPIFRFTTTQTHSWSIESLTFSYSSAQPVANTLAIPLYFALDSGSGGDGYYNFKISDCAFTDGYYGISQRQDAQGITLWGAHISDCTFGGTLSGGAIYIQPNPSIGQPNISLENLYINCGNMTKNAILIGSSDTVLLKSVELNNGTYSAGQYTQVLIQSCTNVTLINTRSEAYTANGNINIWDFSGSTALIIGSSQTGFTANASANVTGIKAGTGGKLSVRGFYFGGTLLSGASGTAVYADTLVSTENIAVSAGMIKYASTNQPLVDVNLLQPNRTKVRGDADVTLTMADLPVQYFNTPTTTNRQVNLPNSGVYDGAEFTIVKYATDTYTLKVYDPLSGKSVTIPASTKGATKWRAVSSGEWIPLSQSTFS